MGVVDLQTPKTKILHLKITLLEKEIPDLETIIFRCYVSFRECKWHKWWFQYIQSLKLTIRPENRPGSKRKFHLNQP